MTVTYITDEDITVKLWDEYDAGWPGQPGWTGMTGFTHWLRDVRIPYADTIKTAKSRWAAHIITFKEEKDLTYFLLTL